MVQEGITTDEIELLGFVKTEKHPASSGYWGMWINEVAGRRLMLWECGPCYFDVSEDGKIWRMAKQLRWPYSAGDVATAMRALGWLA